MEMHFHIGDVTNTDEGVAYSIYIYGNSPSNGGGSPNIPLGKRIGMVGRRHDNDYEWYATPVDHNPLHNAPGTRVDFKTRKEACLWLLGVFDAFQPWMVESRQAHKEACDVRAETSKARESVHYGESRTACGELPEEAREAELVVTDLKKVTCPACWVVLRRTY